MAKISRLKLAGVRSFGPDELQDIPFQAPVTLILGENGCGKTTIIEALKYACTAEAPGGGKDKASFLFNPQLRSASSTKAVIKLKLIDRDGKEILINRAMRVDQISPTSKTFKAMDSTLTITDSKGKSQTISTRCIDVSTIVCERLGVSQSILSSVIFCHQENSLWPLSEGKNVKEMFDEIFDSVKYNKCITNINELIKNQRVDIKAIAGQLVFKQDKKRIVDRKREVLEKDERDLEKIVEEIEKKNEEIIPIDNELTKIIEKENNFAELKQKLSAKQTEKRSLEQNQKELREKLKQEFVGDDDELKFEIKVFEEKISKLPTIEEIRVKIDNFNKLIQKSQERIGKLTAEKDQYNETVINRNKCINNLKSELNIEADHDVVEMIGILKTSLNKLKVTIQELEIKHGNEEDLLQKDIDTKREDVAKIKEKINSCSSQIKQIKQKIREVGLQLNLLGNSGEELKQLTLKVDKIDNDLKKLSSSFNIDETENSIKIIKQEIFQLEEQQTLLEQDQKVLQNNFELENNIETRLKDIREKENKIYHLKNSRFDEFRVVFDEVPETNLKSELEDVLSDNRRVLDDVQKQLEVSRSEVTNQEASIKFNKEKLAALQEELEGNLGKIRSLTKGQDYDEFHKKIETEFNFYQDSKGQLAAAKVLYEKFLKTFISSKPCCPICDTDFKGNESAVSSIVNKMRSTLKNIPSQLSETEEKLNKTQTLFNLSQQTKPLYEKTKFLEEKLIPEVTETINKLNLEYVLSKTERDDLEYKLKKPREILEIATKIMSDATLIDKYQSEIQAYKSEVVELEEQTTAIKSGKSRDEVEAEIKICKSNISQKRNLCESKQEQLVSFRNQLQDLKEKQHKLLDKKLQIEKTMHGKPQLLEKEKELKAEETVLQNTIKTLDHEITPTEKKLSQSIQSLKEKKLLHKNEITKRTDHFNKLNQTYQKINQHQIEIESFEKKDIKKEFIEQESKLHDYKEKINGLNSQRDLVSGSLIKRRELQDNLEIRLKQNTIASISKIIIELESQVKGYNYSNLYKQKQILVNKHSIILEETHRLSGKKEQLESTIKDEKEELERPEFKNAYSAYMRKYYELKIKENGLIDLQIYAKGLENVIIEFHKQKMISVNALIKEYWRSIYRGNDIDFIQIKTEQTESKGATSRRAYNYKVIQIKNDTEIEMRGCCSAGQKILACLIIRMALSSVFSHNCGILALDEPTTNLDRENVMSLSEALATMINDRKVERNFQLLIITHDEDFVRTLSQVGSIEECLKVKRNNDGLSVVQPQVIL
nr:DNA repair protein RAD50-like [Onthophagus taurus]XP_022912403.1 DNA repair protein RAD50-like [Onthophagus taurus]XP_022912411.1 DNA repair protein RAD50-like [Onthophagus taurus]